MTTRLPPIGRIERLTRHVTERRWPNLPEFYLVNRHNGLKPWAAFKDARLISLRIRGRST